MTTDDQAHFERLVAEAQRQEFRGWDFSFIEGRWRESPPSWDYRHAVLRHLRHVGALLDLGTGGGEFLSSLSPLPSDTCATEGFPPNLPLARASLEPLGAEVVETLPGDRLPVDDARFDLVIDRHESFAPREVYRVLRPGGRFVTQQVGGATTSGSMRYCMRGEVASSTRGLSTAPSSNSRRAGFLIVDGQEEFPETVFFDVGAVVYYLKAVPWQIPGFAVEKCRDPLFALHTRILADGGLVVKSHRFLIEACRE